MIKPVFLENFFEFLVEIAGKCQGRLQAESLTGSFISSPEKGCCRLNFGWEEEWANSRGTEGVESTAV
jgi:hypothetical protein